MAIVLAATRDGLHIVEPHGDSPSHFAGHRVGHVVADGSRWWALVGSDAVWVCEDGAAWTDAGRVGAEATCLLPVDGDVLVGTEEAHLHRLGGGRVDGFERVPGRDEWYTPWGGPPAVRSADADDQGLWVNVHVGGIPRSTDGDRWEPTIDIDSDVHQVVCHDGRVHAATAWGVATSDDAGATWSFNDDGLRHTYCRAIAVADGRLLVSASSGPGGGDSTLYAKGPGDEGFTPCGGGFPDRVDGNIDTFWLSASGSTVACGLPDGRILLSDDAGESWTEFASGLPSLNAIVCLT